LSRLSNRASLHTTARTIGAPSFEPDMTAQQGTIDSYLDLHPEVTAALAGGRPVVALESTAITLGLPRAGIRAFATGGIGGVHRGGQISLDISADLAALASSPVALVSAGVKLIQNLEKTLEVFETYSVSVIVYGCDDAPAFYCRGAGIAVQIARADAASAAG
jgi:pseudouridine-5'-phosphate glycosidase